VSKVEAESAAALASAHGEAEGFTRRVALLKGDVVNAHQARDMTEENFQCLSGVVADADRQWEEAQRECRELVQELTLLQTRGSELCQAIVGPLKVRGSTVRENMDCCHLPYRDGRAARHIPSGGVFHRAILARMFTH
jgi:hypothetical protein